MLSDLDAAAPQAVTITSVSTTSSAAVRIHPVAGTVGKQKIVVQSDIKTYIRFGTSGMTAASLSDEELEAGVSYKFSIDSTSTHFRAVATGSGTLAHFVEGYAP